MIEVRDVSKYYGDIPAVVDVSFQVPRGQLFTLIGRSGSGKSTLIKMLNRLISFESGSILIDGKDIRQEDPVQLRRRMGYVIQNVGLFPHYTVLQNLAVVPKLLGWPIERIKERSAEMMILLGLDPKVQGPRFPHELSGGQQQRVGIARALVAEPPILLMDEPFAALDTLTKEEIHREFALLRHKLEQTVVWVTHDVQAAFTLSDRVCVLDQGEVMQIGTPGELLFTPQNAFIEDFVKDHRVALTQEVLTIGDLIPQIEIEAAHGDELPFVSLETPIRSLLGLRLGIEDMLLLIDEKGDTVGRVSLRDLIHAFINQQQKTISHP